MPRGEGQIHGDCGATGDSEAARPWCVGEKEGLGFERGEMEREICLRSGEFGEMTFFAQNEVLEKQNGLFMGTFKAEMTLFYGEVIPQIIEICSAPQHISLICA